MATMTDVKTVAVVGTGVIGAPYVALFLAKGLRVITSPTKKDGASKLKALVSESWPVLEKLGLGHGASQANLEIVDDVFQHLHRVDLVQENGPESLEYKRSTFAALDAGAPPHVPLISTSSGFPSSTFISGCKVNPSRVLIAHPFNPPHILPSVEVVPHPGTDTAIIELVCSFIRAIGQRPIRVNLETPGFVLNRLQTAMIMEANSLVLRGVISPADLDAAVTGGIGLRMSLNGPYMSMGIFGGGGASGFARFLQHIVPATKVWVEDMDKHRRNLGEDQELLAEKVTEMFDDLPYNLAERTQRADDTFTDFVLLKKNRDLM